MWSGGGSWSELSCQGRRRKAKQKLRILNWSYYEGIMDFQGYFEWVMAVRKIKVGDNVCRALYDTILSYLSGLGIQVTHNYFATKSRIFKFETRASIF